MILVTGIDNPSRAWDLPTAMRTVAPFAVAIVVTAVLWAATFTCARAGENEPEAAAEALWLLGQHDEDTGAFALALEHDRACIARAPGSRWAARASDRIEWIRARSEGDFAPLARLERVRRDPTLSSDPEAVATLAREADAFPPGLVRVEARLLVAEAWLGRLDRPADAERVLRLVESDPSADPLTARLAARELVDSAIARGALEAATADAEAYANRLDPRFVAHVRRLGRRRALRYAAMGELLLFAVLSALAVVRAVRRSALGDVARALRGFAPVAALFGAYVAGVGGFLASRYDSGSAAPFLWLGAVTVPLVLCARVWSAAGAPNGAARGVRAILSAASVFAAAFILLDAVDPMYLDGFGL